VRREGPCKRTAYDLARAFATEAHRSVKIACPVLVDDFFDPPEHCVNLYENYTKCFLGDNSISLKGVLAFSSTVESR